jgi:exopolysaccharide biosynthesis WecB/TagA/CpsF family protein
MKKKKLTLVTNFDNFNLNTNFIFSAFNLAFIAYFFLGFINPSKNFFLWCDGIIGKLFSNSKKIPGHQFISFFFNYKFAEIIVMGNYSKLQNNYLKKKFKTKVKFIKLPVINKFNIKRFALKHKKNALILITIPTPKQEMLAMEIRKKNKHYKIVCIGGGLSIASGEIRKCPKFLEIFGLEFIWRLNTDTLRRIHRLTYTFMILILNIRKIFTKIKIIKV